jgi:hypothetical protein
MTATILQFEPRPTTTDGGKARILRRRAAHYEDAVERADRMLLLFKFHEDLTMDQADPCDIPSDSAYPSPQG